MKFFEFSPTEELMKRLQVSTSGVMNSGQFVGSAELAKFEAEFARYLGSEFVVGCGNGFDAIRLSLRALGIGPDSIVAVPSHTFFATWLAVLEVGAIPLGIDVDIETGQMSVTELERHLDKISAIIVVHMHGIEAPIEEICALTKTRNIRVIEDCAQAHGLRTGGGAMAGTLGDLGAFSFYPTKNLPSAGDAGALVTSSKVLARIARATGNYGWTEVRYDHRIPGFNSRLDEIQAGYLNVMLSELDNMNLRRKQIADRYIEALGTSAKEIILGFGKTNVWHHFNLRCKNRSRIQDLFHSRSIPTNVYYPIPCHKQQNISSYAQMSPFPPSWYELKNAEILSSELLAVPLNQWMSNDQVEEVCEALDSIKNKFEE